MQRRPVQPAGTPGSSFSRFDELLGYALPILSGGSGPDRNTGYKFETLSLIPKPWDETSRDFIEARETAIVNNHAQYCSVVKTAIGKNNKMIIGGEVDAG